MERQRSSSIFGPTKQQLRPVSVEGGNTKLWGSYPARLRVRNHFPHGTAYQISKHDRFQNQGAKPERCTPDRYGRRAEMIAYGDGISEQGCIFP